MKLPFFEKKRSTIVIDEMVLVHKQTLKSDTFMDYAVQLFAKVVRLMRYIICIRAELIFDQ